MKHFQQKSHVLIRQAISLMVMLAFGIQLVLFPCGIAQAQSLVNLPALGTTISLTKPFEPPTLLGMTIHPENPFLFDFLVDRGEEQLSDDNLSGVSDQLVKYFLSAMTVPDADSWVNLSPYEKDRIMPDYLSATEMGKTMLEQDYLLKQLSASLTNPEQELGRRFWDAVKKKSFERFGTTDLPMSTLNKVWIVPQKALILEKDAFVVIGDSRLKVMLEEDYEALAKTSVIAGIEDAKQSQIVSSFPKEAPEAQLKNGSSIKTFEDDISTLSSEVFRDMILPELEKEINEGSTFAPVRQIYHAVILATWFKKNLRESLLGKVYVDQNKVAGIDTAQKNIKEKVYQQYLSAFQQGAYNLIKEDLDLAGKETLPRKYFSGGTSFASSSLTVVTGDLSNPGVVGREALVGISDKMKKSRLASASVQLADSGRLAQAVVVASSNVRNQREFDLRGSSALTALDLVRNAILLGTVEAIKDFGDKKGQVVSAAQVLVKIQELYPQVTITEEKIVQLFTVELKLNEVSTGDAPGWIFDEAFTGRIKEQFILSAIKASLVSNIGEMYQQLALFENIVPTDDFMDEWIRLSSDWKAGRVDSESLGLTLDSAVLMFFASDDHQAFVAKLLVDATKAQALRLASSSLMPSFDNDAPIISDTGIRAQKGGIDFNPDLFDLQIKRDGKGVPLPLPQQDLKNINIQGLYPVIINIEPANLQNFPLLSSLQNQSVATAN